MTHDGDIFIPRHTCIHHLPISGDLETLPVVPMSSPQPQYLPTIDCQREHTRLC